jgi:hypothetical protein
MTSHGNAAAAAGELLKISQDPAATPTAFRDATRRLGASVDSLKLIRDSMGRSLLHNAAQSGSSALVEHLIDKLGFDVNVQDERGKWLLAQGLLTASTGTQINKEALQSQVATYVIWLDLIPLHVKQLTFMSVSNLQVKHHWPWQQPQGEQTLHSSCYAVQLMLTAEGSRMAQPLCTEQQQ